MIANEWTGTPIDLFEGGVGSFVRTWSSVKLTDREPNPLTLRRHRVQVIHSLMGKITLD